MTGIGDLQTVFGAGTTQKSDGVGESQAATKSSAGRTDEVVGAFGSEDQSVVSLTAGALQQGVANDDVRADKVAQLQAAIANGSYNVSSADVADKLIQSMLSGS